jgi:hypothetical protein
MVMEVRVGIDWNADTSIATSMLGSEKSTEVMDELAKPPDPMDVTLAGITTAPAQSVCPVTTLEAIVKYPVVQRTVPSVPL